MAANCLECCGESEPPVNRRGGFPPHMGWRLLIRACWHHCTYYLIRFNISSSHFPQETILYSQDFSLLSYLFLLILHWHTSHRADLMYGVLKWCLWQSVSSLPYKVLCCMFSFISLPALSHFFHLRAAAIPFPFALLVGCVEWKTCEEDIKWPIQTSEVYIKWAIQACEVYISCLNAVIL